MPLKLHYELIGPIDNVIKNLMEFGLIDFWTRLSVGPTTRSKVAETKAKQHDAVHTLPDGTVVLTMQHIVGAVVIMAIGYGLALIAFVIERFVHRRVHEGTDSRIIMYLHAFCRPNRFDCIVMESSFDANAVVHA